MKPKYKVGNAVPSYVMYCHKIYYDFVVISSTQANPLKILDVKQVKCFQYEVQNSDGTTRWVYEHQLAG